ncbi:dapdiamide synthesis protein DdaC-like [Branchiostoma floridae]|uniref:Dapdiamide synthesis protein DdaC-like n=1 Tax=Branchiostoma floridae TaxID=7739 RepID=A0A9J7LQ61_BRAFL|nr:dapdiamide synthesis protein DdaC-like [Branchiostoma floridae]
MMATVTSMLRGAFRSSRAAVRLSCRAPYSTEAAAPRASGVSLAETQVDWPAEVQAQPPVRVRGRPWLPGSHSPNFPEFLAPPRPGYPRVFTPDGQGGGTPEECAVPARKVLEDLLDKENEGAVLFRGLPLSTPEDFSRFMSNLGLKLISYQGGSSVRHNLAASVDTASNEPPNFCIEPHNEMAYTDHFPEKISFFCLQPAAPGKGGETVLTDVREVLPRLDSAVVDKFRKLGVRYFRHVPNRAPGSYTSWQEVFLTEDKSVVDSYMKANDMGYQWESDGSLSWWTTLPALRTYKGEEIWFTQPHSMNASYFKAHPDWSKKDIPDNRYPFHTYYGDGSDIPLDVLQHIRDVCWQVSVGFQLQKGDLIMLNNMYVKHARMSFTGERKLAISLALQKN